MSVQINRGAILPRNSQRFDASGNWVAPAGVEIAWLTGAAPGGGAGPVSGATRLQIANLTLQRQINSDFLGCIGNTVVAYRGSSTVNLSWIDPTVGSPAWTDISLPNGFQPIASNVTVRAGLMPWLILPSRILIANWRYQTSLSSGPMLLASTDGRAFAAPPGADNIWVNGNDFDYTASLFRSPNGRVFLFSLWSSSQHMFNTSIDGGATFTGRQIASHGLSMSGNSVFAASNTAVVGIHTTSNDGYRLTNFVSPNPVAISSPGGGHQPNAILCTRAGSFLLVCGNGSNTSSIRRSTNDGQSFTEVFTTGSRSPFRDMSSSPILELGSGLLVTFSSAGGEGIRMVWSANDGNSWTETAVLLGFGGSMPRAGRAFVVGGDGYVFAGFRLLRIRDGASPTVELLANPGSYNTGGVGLFRGSLAEMGTAGQADGSDTNTFWRYPVEGANGGDVTFGSLLTLRGGRRGAGATPGLGGGFPADGYAAMPPPADQNAIRYPGRNGRPAAQGTGQAGGGGGGGAQFGADGVNGAAAADDGQPGSGPGAGAGGIGSSIAGGGGGESVVRFPIRVTPGTSYPITIPPAPIGANGGFLTVEWP